MWVHVSEETASGEGYMGRSIVSREPTLHTCYMDKTEDRIIVYAALNSLGYGYGKYIFDRVQKCDQYIFSEHCCFFFWIILHPMKNTTG